MIFRLLAEETNTGAPQYVGYIALAIIAVLAIIFFVVNGRKNKQELKELEEELKAITQGTKIKTVGGICGIVVEVCADNTIVIETGGEESGKSYVKIDKRYVEQTDLNLHPEKNKGKEEKSAEQSAEAPAQKEEEPALPLTSEKEEEPKVSSEENS